MQAKGNGASYAWLAVCWPSPLGGRLHPPFVLVPVYYFYRIPAPRLLFLFSLRRPPFTHTRGHRCVFCCCCCYRFVSFSAPRFNSAPSSTATTATTVTSHTRKIPVQYNRPPVEESRGRGQGKEHTPQNTHKKKGKKKKINRRRPGCTCRRIIHVLNRTGSRSIHHTQSSNYATNRPVPPTCPSKVKQAP